jgi:hypothetical protein
MVMLTAVERLWTGIIRPELSARLKVIIDETGLIPSRAGGWANAPKSTETADSEATCGSCLTSSGIL